MSIDKLYERLERKDFLNPSTADIFSPFFFYTYNASEEYQVRREIELLKQKLQRPLAMVDTLIINIYEILIEYLKNQTVAGKTQFDLLLELDKNGSDRLTTSLERLLSKKDFIQFLLEKIKSYLSEDSHLKKVYVFIHGFGTVYPYLRAHKLVSRLEEYVKVFKVIIFYPGQFSGSNYKLFGKLEANNIYRANNLNALLEN
ncbi:MAG: BREX protein BrxB domain-containing protein [Cyclobacteriaceae bacterium]